MHECEAAGHGVFTVSICFCFMEGIVRAQSRWSAQYNILTVSSEGHWEIPMHSFHLSFSSRFHSSSRLDPFFVFYISPVSVSVFCPSPSSTSLHPNSFLLVSSLQPTTTLYCDLTIFISAIYVRQCSFCPGETKN